MYGNVCVHVSVGIYDGNNMVILVFLSVKAVACYSDQDVVVTQV